MEFAALCNRKTSYEPKAMHVQQKYRGAVLQNSPHTCIAKY
jgi:hypothetical protein